jgi:UDP-N-acetylmuramyl pentapeptide phosphotransferase/UDP-N-acetylglucosamine-1-phosphate transferase
MLNILIISFLATFILTFLVRKFAIRKAILDIPSDRSSHSVPTPRGGGLAIAIVWFAILLLLYNTSRIDKNLFFTLLMGIPLAICGLLDDLIHLKPWIRLLIQMLCAGSALFIIGGLNQFHILTLTFHSPFIFSFVAFIGIIWSINLFNFLDGIDGYIGTEIIFIGIAIYVLSGDQVVLIMASITLGFLLWNWQRAKIFMGDVGSTLLGFNIAVLTIYHQNNALVSLPIWLIITSVFWFDATMTLFRRIRNKENLSQAHKTHAYQRIVQAGFSHQKTVLCSFILNIIGFCFAYFAMIYTSLDWIFLLCDLLILYGVLKQIDKKSQYLTKTKQS